LLNVLRSLAIGKHHESKRLTVRTRGRSCCGKEHFVEICFGNRLVGVAANRPCGRKPVEK